MKTIRQTLKSVLSVFTLLLLAVSVGFSQTMALQTYVEETTLEESLEVEEIEIDEEIIMVVLDTDLNILFEGTEKEFKNKYKGGYQLDTFTEIDNKKYFIK